MSFRRLCPLLVLALAASCRAATFESYFTGSRVDAQPARVRPGLLLAGGGGDVDEAFRWFAGLADGGDVVVLRASGADGYNDYLHREIGGFNSVESIVFKEASAARDPRVLASLARAEAIFLAGGDQSRYIAYWRGTPVGEALAAHAAAGRPLGGTSAGLAVLGEAYFSADRDTIDSDSALANPFDPRITLGSDFLALPALAGVVTDTHFMARDRLGRLIVFLARLEAETPRPRRWVGLGVDEATALCIDEDGSARVLTARGGRVWLVELARAAEPLAAGRPLAIEDVRVTALGPESRLQFPSLEISSRVERRTVSVRGGALIDSP